MKNSMSTTSVVVLLCLLAAARSTRVATAPSDSADLDGTLRLLLDNIPTSFNQFHYVNAELCNTGSKVWSNIRTMSVSDGSKDGDASALQVTVHTENSDKHEISIRPGNCRTVKITERSTPSKDMKSNALKLVHIGISPDKQPISEMNLPISGRIPASFCRFFHRNVHWCDRFSSTCAYYYCSHQCHPRGTSNCNAGCRNYCPGVSCSRHHGNVHACDRQPGCAYYYCSHQCHRRGTSNCGAGCRNYCPWNTCSRYNGNVGSCDRQHGCAYYYCSHQCHRRGTSNCKAGCRRYC